MTIRRALAGALAGALTLALLTGTPSHADPDPKLRVTDVKLSKSTTAATGLATAKVDVTVKAGYDSTDPADDKLTLFVRLDYVSGPGPLSSIVSTPLQRTAGTLADGTWTGRLNVASRASGTYRVTSVYTGRYVGQPAADGVPFDGPALKNTGSHMPRIDRSYPKVVPAGQPYTITWTIVDTATNKPYGVPLTAQVGANGAQCAAGSRQAQVVRTTAAGAFTRTFKAGDAKEVNCFQINADPYLSMWSWVAVRRSTTISATPARTAVPVGTNVGVSGVLSGGADLAWCTVELQRLHGASAWRIVNRARIRESGRYTTIATPSAKGRIAYRVQMPECQLRFVPATSKTFWITGQ